VGRIEVKTFQSFYFRFLEINDPVHKLASITTDGGAMTMIIKNVVLIGK
jgi:hypothetical protein